MSAHNINDINLKSIPTKTWVKLAIWVIAILLFAIWIGNGWVLLLIPFVADAYITHYIPWRWWEKSPHSWVRYTMKWVEDIVVVLVILQVLSIFVFQQFKIPTSSLEKTCLVGDRLFVSKLSYGPRIPFTPLAFPLVHNRFPWGGKSYIETPNRTYKRAPGLGSVERGDIVVFNFPTGDTVPLKVQNPDYYTLVKQFGRDRIHSDVQTFGKVVYRPVDMREHYVKRCVGMPGDSLMIRDNALYINGKKMTPPEHMQLNYFVQTDGTYITDDDCEVLGISPDDRLMLRGDQAEYEGLFRQLEMEPVSGNDFGNIYHFPLTAQALQKLKGMRGIRKIAIEPDPSREDFPTFPLYGTANWTRDNYGPLLIPMKGLTIPITPENLPLYERCIRNYEGHALEVRNGRILIDGNPADTYTFGMDYYFMMGDNRHNSADSRAWGFVPEDHIVGKPLVVWLSIDKDKPLFGGRVRWNRFFTVPK